MLRLLLTITRYWPAVGGAELHTRELLRSFQGVESTIVAHWSRNRTDWLLGTTLRAPLRAESYADEARTVHVVAPSLGDRLRLFPLMAGYYPLMPLSARVLGSNLARKIDDVAGELDVVHNVRIGREPLSLASLQLARARDVPFVFTPNHHERWTGWRYWVYHDVQRKADAVVALTEIERRTLIRLGARPERVHVTGIGPVLAESADGERVRRRHSLPERFVLFLGQKHGYKGFEALLGATQAVWRRHPEVGFVFVGPRTEESQRVFAGVQDPRILELGQVDLQEKTDLLAACELLCVPSAQESFGGVIVEGWASGKPVVAGPAPAASEIIADGVDGRFSPEQTPAAIAERVTGLLDDPARAREMGAAGARKVAERFTWTKLAERMSGIYRSLG